MAENSWPFDNQDTTETQYSMLFSRLRESGVWGEVGDNVLRVVGDSSGMQVKLSPGMALVRGHFYHNTSELTISVPASASSARVDAVVLRLNPAENSISAAVVQGIPGSSEAPSLSQTQEGIFEFLIAEIAVGASVSTISAGNVTDRREFCGDDFGHWSTSRRPKNPRIGKAGYNTTSGRPEFWSGSEWREFSPATIAAAIIEGVLALANIPNLPASRITSGELDLARIPTIPLSKGGTGATSLTAAQQALNIYVQSSAPAHSNGRVWIRRP